MHRRLGHGFEDEALDSKVYAKAVKGETCRTHLQRSAQTLDGEVVGRLNCSRGTSPDANCYCGGMSNCLIDVMQSLASCVCHRNTNVGSDSRGSFICRSERPANSFLLLQILRVPPWPVTVNA